MTDTKNHTVVGGSLEGRVFRPSSAAELAEAVELAFDYRGDVTLVLTSGEAVVGVITSYSIHYTKLYESEDYGREERPIALAAR